MNGDQIDRLCRNWLAENCGEEIASEYTSYSLIIPTRNTPGLNDGLETQRQILCIAFGSDESFGTTDYHEARKRLRMREERVQIPEVFGALKSTPPGMNQEIQLTDALVLLLQKQAIYAYEFEGERYDAGTLFGWLEATIALALERPDIGPRLRDYLSGLLQPEAKRGRNACVVLE